MMICHEAKKLSGLSHENERIVNKQVDLLKTAVEAFSYWQLC